METEEPLDFPEEGIEPEPVMVTADNRRPSDDSVIRAVQSVISIALVMATLLTLWNPRKVFKTPNLNALLSQEPTAGALAASDGEDTSSHIGILAGHWLDSTGDVCPDGLSEADVNLEVANQLTQLLKDMGYEADLFPEFDLALLNYKARALVAIYSGSCLASPAAPSGFKIGSSLTAANPDTTNTLAVCLAEAYQEKIKLPFTYEIINPDHHAYHIFRDIDKSTPAVLIEIGSLYADRQLITSHSNRVAEAIMSGLMCFLEPD
jgi:N-acetylmuramoyl-L-alanine amidase